MTGTDRLDALLLLASTCPYCPTVLAAPGDLVKSGDVGRLEVVNIGARPDIAQQHGSAPCRGCASGRSCWRA
jgi:hypothetical protein